MERIGNSYYVRNKIAVVEIDEATYRKTLTLECGHKKEGVAHMTYYKGEFMACFECGERIFQERGGS